MTNNSELRLSFWQKAGYIFLSLACADGITWLILTKLFKIHPNDNTYAVVGGVSMAAFMAGLNGESEYSWGWIAAFILLGMMLPSLLKNEATILHRVIIINSVITIPAVLGAIGYHMRKKVISRNRS